MRDYEDFIDYLTETSSNCVQINCNPATQRLLSPIRWCNVSIAMLHYSLWCIICYSCCEVSCQHVPAKFQEASLCLSMSHLSVCGPDCEWVKRPRASLQFTVCERKVIRVIVTSTMIKLGQCNPHPPPPQARLKKEKKKNEDAVTSLCAWIWAWGHWSVVCFLHGSVSVLCWDWRHPQIILTCSFLPCSLCFTVSRYNLSPCIFSLPTLFLSASVVLTISSS